MNEFNKYQLRHRFEFDINICFLIADYFWSKDKCELLW